MSMRKNLTLWAVQGLLAALSLFAGGMKLVELAHLGYPAYFVTIMGV